MQSKPQAPQPDPALTAQTQAAQQQQVQQIQQGLSSQSLDLLRQFGQSSAAKASGIVTPFSGAAGGFATPMVSPGGSLK
jgi:hypothetical protein